VREYATFCVALVRNVDCSLCQVEPSLLKMLNAHFATWNDSLKV
jgi:hypothetical protein